MWLMWFRWSWCSKSEDLDCTRSSICSRDKNIKAELYPIINYQKHSIEGLFYSPFNSINILWSWQNMYIYICCSDSLYGTPRLLRECGYFFIWENIKKDEWAPVWPLCLNIIKPFLTSTWKRNKIQGGGKKYLPTCNCIKTNTSPSPSVFGDGDGELLDVLGCDERQKAC